MTQLVSDVMGPAEEAVDISIPAETVKRRLEGDQVTAIIVTQNMRPVGYISARNLPANVNGKMAVDIMDRDVPIVFPEMTIAEAATQLGEFDADMIAVADRTTGAMVGFMLREQLVYREAEYDAAAGQIQTTDPNDVEWTVSIKEGMDVLDANREKCGEVEDVVTNANGRITHVIIRHGMMGRHKTRIPIDDVTGYANDRISLAMSEDDLERLPRLED